MNSHTIRIGFFMIFMKFLKIFNFYKKIQKISFSREKFVKFRKIHHFPPKAKKTSIPNDLLVFWMPEIMGIVNFSIFTEFHGNTFFTFYANMHFYW